MKYPLVPLVNDLTFPILFFWFCLPFVILLIVIIIWLQLLLNEAEEDLEEFCPASRWNVQSLQLGRKSHVQVFYMFFLSLFLVQMLTAEKVKKLSSDESDSDFKFEDEPSEEEIQNDTSTTEMQEETQSSQSVGKLRPKPAYLSSNSKSQKQSLFAVMSESWSQRQKIRYSHAEKSNFCNIVMLICTMLASLTWNFVCQLLQISNVLRIQLLPSSPIIYVAQLFVLLGEEVGKILVSLRLKSRELLAPVLGGKLEQSGEAQRTTSG